MGGGGSDIWEKLPKNPVFFFWQAPLDKIEEEVKSLLNADYCLTTHNSNPDNYLPQNYLSLCVQDVNRGSDQNAEHSDHPVEEVKYSAINIYVYV